MLKQEIDEYLSPKEILKQYPGLERFNWRAAELAKFLECKLVQGYYYKSNRTSVIRKSSLQKLIRYVEVQIRTQVEFLSSNLECKPGQDEFLSPKEILDKYPDVYGNLNWTPMDLGSFVTCHLLEGYFNRNRKCTLIRESSLVSLILYANSLLDEQKCRTIY